MNVGIIGMGFVGQLHLKAMKMIDQNIKCYVYDLRSDIAQEFAKKYGCSVISTLEEMYDSTDAIIIATPTFTHYELTMRAIRKGKHVLCEKPMALTVSEAKKMVEMAKQKKVVCAIGFNYRFFEITEIFRKTSQIGEICDIQILIKRLFRKDWHNSENGVLADLGIHLMSIIFENVLKKIKH